MTKTSGLKQQAERCEAGRTLKQKRSKGNADVEHRWTKFRKRNHTAGINKTAGINQPASSWREVPAELAILSPSRRNATNQHSSNGNANIKQTCIKQSQHTTMLQHTHLLQNIGAHSTAMTTQPSAQRWNLGFQRGATFTPASCPAAPTSAVRSVAVFERQLHGQKTRPQPKEPIKRTHTYALTNTGRS